MVKKPSKRDKSFLFTDKEGVTIRFVPVEDPVILEELNRQLDEEKEEGKDLIMEELNRQLEEEKKRE